MGIACPWAQEEGKHHSRQAVRGPGTKICVKLSPEMCWVPLSGGEASEGITSGVQRVHGNSQSSCLSLQTVPSPSVVNGI